MPSSPPKPPRLLITAGPTHEPIDAVRYIGNRSSGRLGVALADAAAQKLWQVTLLLGPVPLAPQDSRVRLERFRTTAELQSLLARHWPQSDALVMAAAVADYRPVSASPGAKIKRESSNLTIELEPTPDLLAACTTNKRPDQFVVGFALEPRDRLEDSARAKLARKNLDLIVANPLETMDSPDIHATLFAADGSRMPMNDPIPKERFASMLLDQIQTRMGASAQSSASQVGAP